MADIPADRTTTAAVTGTGTYTSALETNGDVDWWRVSMAAGYQYMFSLTGNGTTDPLDSGTLALYDAAGNEVTTGVYLNADGTVLSFSPTTRGGYFLHVKDGDVQDGLAEGSYKLIAAMSDSILNSMSTTAVISGTGTINGGLDQTADSDWYRVSLEAGFDYTFQARYSGYWGVPGSRVNIILRDDEGNILEQTGEWHPFGIDYVPQETGEYFIEIVDVRPDVGNGAPAKDYKLVSFMDDGVKGSPATNAVIADGQYLIGTADAEGDDDWYRFDAVKGVTYTVVMKEMTDSGVHYSSLSVFAPSDLEDAIARARPPIDRHGTATLSFTASSDGPLFIAARGDITLNIDNRYSLQVTSNGVIGTAGNDLLEGDAMANLLVGWAGNDTLLGNGGNDTLRAGAGVDVLNGGQGIDIVDFSGGSAATASLSIAGPQQTGWGTASFISIEGLRGTFFADRLVGNNVANTLFGGGGNDFIFGAAGDDILLGGYGHDTINGGSGTDTLIFDTPGPAQVDLLLTGAQWTGQGNDLIKEIENVQGNNGNDIFLGSGGNNILHGLGGNDLLAGRAGNDRLNGGDGVDTLRGGTGNDVLTGGNGADVFKFVQGDGTDRILDYAQGVDRIDLQTLTGPTAELVVTQAGADTQVWYGDIRIVLVGVDVTQMGSEDFIFT